MKPQEPLRKQGEPSLQRGLWGGLIFVLIGVIGAGIWSLVREQTAARTAAPEGSSRLPIYGSVPEFSLIERSGRTIDRLDFLGKIWIVDFIYTHCLDSCPLQSAEMARLQADLASESDVRLASITVDPARDTPQVLSKYADRFKAHHGRWLFLTGEKEAIYRLAQEGLRLPILDPRNKAGVLGRSNNMLSGALGSRKTRRSGQGTSNPEAGAASLLGAVRVVLEPRLAVASERLASTMVLHSSRFVLVDRKARIRSYYDSTDVDSLQKLRQDVKGLLQEE